MRRPQLLDWILLAVIVVLWGTSFFMTKVAVTHMDPMWVMALRLLVAGIVLWAYVWISGLSLPRERKLWQWFTWLGFIGNALPFFLVSWGTQFVTSGLSGVLMGAIPLTAIVIAHFVLPDERLNMMKSIGFVVGFAGLIVVIGVDKLADLSSEWQAVLGEAAILAGCLCYAIHGVAARRIPYSRPVEQAAAVSLAGAAIGIVMALIAAPQGPVADSFSAYLAVIGLGVFPTGVASVLVYRLVRACGISFVTYSNYLVPVFALLLGAIGLNEPVSWNVVAGLLLVLAGIAVSRLRSFRPEPS